jgi:hypothetical protein
VNAKDIFKGVETVLVIDWPSNDVPESLARAGLNVVVRGGPGPEDYSTYEMNKGGANDGKVTERRTGRPPEHADLIYSYRPLSELPGIVATAKELGAKTIWSQSGVTTGGVSDAKGCWAPEEELRLARNLVESVGLNLVSEPYIGDVARDLRIDDERAVSQRLAG